MNEFKTKFPAFTALLILLGDFGKEMGDHNDSFIKNITDSIKLFPQLMSFVPQAGQIDDEAKLILQDPQMILNGAEILVIEFGFSQDKAKNIIGMAFPYASKLASLVPDTKALIAAIKA